MGDGDRYGAVAREKRLFWIALYCIRWRLGGVLQTRFCRFVNLQSFFLPLLGPELGGIAQLSILLVGNLLDRVRYAWFHTHIYPHASFS